MQKRTVADKRVELNSALHDGARVLVVYKRVEIDGALGDGAKAILGPSASKRLSAAQRGWPARE